jgi:hypothetical protein
VKQDTLLAWKVLHPVKCAPVADSQKMKGKAPVRSVHVGSIDRMQATEEFATNVNLGRHKMCKGNQSAMSALQACMRVRRRKKSVLHVNFPHTLREMQQKIAHHALADGRRKALGLPFATLALRVASKRAEERSLATAVMNTRRKIRAESVLPATSMIWKNNRFAQGVAVASSRYLRDRLPAEVAREVFQAPFTTTLILSSPEKQSTIQTRVHHVIHALGKMIQCGFQEWGRALAGPSRG